MFPTENILIYNYDCLEIESISTFKKKRSHMYSHRAGKQGANCRSSPHTPLCHIQYPGLIPRSITDQLLGPLFTLRPYSQGTIKILVGHLAFPPPVDLLHLHTSPVLSVSSQYLKTHSNTVATPGRILEAFLTRQHTVHHTLLRPEGDN